MSRAAYTWLRCTSYIHIIRSFEQIAQPARVTRYQPEEHFPHGPRNLDEVDEEQPQERQGRSKESPLEETKLLEDAAKESNKSAPRLASAGGRRKRSLIVSDRKVRSADVGVSGIYEVISEADLAFSPDSHAEAVTVFQGRIREEVVYGICLPISGFSALFVIVALSAVISALVAGAMLHRLQAQRELNRGNRKNISPISTGHSIVTAVNGSNNEINHHAGWLQAYGLFRVRCTDRSRDERSSEH